MVKWDFKVDKPIFMVLHGLSVKELLKRWDEFKDFDVLWASMNHCKYIEEVTQRPFDILVWYCQHIDCRIGNYKHLLTASKARGNSPLEFVLQCQENDVKDLVFFGMDGFSPHPDVTYAEGTYEWAAHENHPKECEHFNNRCPKEMKERIINVSPGSHYDLKTMTYDEFLSNCPYKKKNS